MNVDQRINDLLVVIVDPTKLLDDQRNAVKQLIRDVLDKVTPEHQGPVQDGKLIGAAYSDWNACRNAMLDKRKELGL